MQKLPNDGIYVYFAPMTGCEIVADWKGGKLVSLRTCGEAQLITPLTAAHVAHELSYLKVKSYTPYGDVMSA